MRGLVAARRGDSANARAVADSLKQQHGNDRSRDLARLYALLGERDSVVKYIGRQPYDASYDLPTRYYPELLPLAGYPPFEQAMRSRH